MASLQSDVIKQFYLSLSERFKANPALDILTLRDMFEQFQSLTAEPTGVHYDEFVAGDIRGLWCLPADASPDSVLLHLHGGAFVAGSPATHRKLVGHLAKAAGMNALIVDYRLAPEHPYPAPIHDGVAAYRHLLDRGFSAERIALSGDSAGGNLAVATAIMLRDGGDPLPAAIACFSPWFDLALTGNSFRENAEKDVFMQFEVNTWLADMYCGEHGQADDPRISPLYGDVTGLPPLYLVAGGFEMLLDDTLRFAERARNGHVEVELEVVPEMQHAHVFMAGRAGEADDSIANAAAWLKTKMPQSHTR